MYASYQREGRPGSKRKEDLFADLGNAFGKGFVMNEEKRV
jgi:hypothetical protein